MACLQTQGGIKLSRGEIVESFVVPVHPHTVLAPEQNQGWGRLRQAYDDAAKIIETSGADLLIIYSTTWPSIIGHQLISDPNPEWVMVDHDFHDLGSIRYSFNIDAEFAKLWNEENKSRGLQSRCVNYHGFPIDVGSVVALTLLNPDNKIPAVIVSSNVYADRSETTVLAKACKELVKRTGRKAVAITAMSLSNRMFTEHIDPKDDRIHSLKDDEWNRKILEFLSDGRLEDVGQLSRTIQQQIRVQKVVNFKPMWWLSAMNDNRNNLTGNVLAYEAIQGAGCAVINLNPAASGFGDKEYDEDDVEVFAGERGVLDSAVVNHETTETTTGPALWEPTQAKGSVNTESAPKPVGAYPHARRVGDLLYLSGVGPRQPGTNEIPGGPIHDSSGNAVKLRYQSADSRSGKQHC